MYSMFFSNIFDTKIVDHKCKPDGAPVMHPEPGYEGALAITMFVQSLFKQLVCNQSGVRQAIHTKNNLDIDAIIRFKEVTEGVFLNDFIGDCLLYTSDAADD